MDTIRGASLGKLRRAFFLGAMSLTLGVACDMGGGGNPGGAAGCDSLTPGDFTCTIGNRSYLLHVPANLASPAPLVVDAHGFGGSSQGQRGNSDWLAMSDQRGFVVAYPQGLGNAFNAQGACCDFANVNDDVGFFRSIVTRTRAAGNIDPQRIFATGFSNGGSMAHTMACTSADMFAAVAPVAFSLAGPGGPNNTASVAAACNVAQPITMIQTHGTADNVANFQAGLLDSLPAPQSLIGWGMVDGCNAATGAMMRFTSNTVCEVRTAGCDGGARVGLCTVQNGAHNVYPNIRATGSTVPQIVYPQLLDAVTSQIAAGNSR